MNITLRTKALYYSIIGLIAIYILSSPLLDNTKSLYGCYIYGDQEIIIDNSNVLLKNVGLSEVQTKLKINKIERVRGYLVYTGHELTLNRKSGKLEFGTGQENSALYVKQLIGYPQQIVIVKRYDGTDMVKILKKPCS